MTIFKVTAMDDVLYIEADNQDAAEKKLFAFTGPMPRSLLHWSQINELPEGEELLP